MRGLTKHTDSVTPASQRAGQVQSRLLGATKSSRLGRRRAPLVLLRAKDEGKDRNLKTPPPLPLPFIMTNSNGPTHARQRWPIRSAYPASSLPLLLLLLLLLSRMVSPALSHFRNSQLEGNLSVSQ